MICFAPSLADSFIFLTLTRLVVVIIFENFSFALFTPPLGDYQRGSEDIREPSKSASGVISQSGNRRSAKGSTLRRWMAAITPAAVSPPFRNASKALRRGSRFFCLS